MPRGCSERPPILQQARKTAVSSSACSGRRASNGERLTVVLEECAEGLVGFAGAAAAVFGEG
jgi:hypothetical protein